MSDEKPTNDDQNDVGRRLRDAILRTGLSVRKFSQITDASYRSVQDYVTGVRFPSADFLRKCALNGIDVNWVLTGKRSLSAKIESEADAAVNLNYGETPTQRIITLIVFAFKHAEKIDENRKKNGEPPLTLKEIEDIVIEKAPLIAVHLDIIWDVFGDYLKEAGVSSEKVDEVKRGIYRGKMSPDIGGATIDELVQGSKPRKRKK